MFVAKKTVLLRCLFSGNRSVDSMQPRGPSHPSWPFFFFLLGRNWKADLKSMWKCKGSRTLQQFLHRRTKLKDFYSLTFRSMGCRHPHGVAPAWRQTWSSVERSGQLWMCPRVCDQLVFNKGSQMNQGRESLFNKLFWNYWIFMWKEWIPIFYLTPYTKINLKQIIALNIKLNLQNSGRKHGGKISWC